MVLLFKLYGKKVFLYMIKNNLYELNYGKRLQLYAHINGSTFSMFIRTL